MWVKVQSWEIKVRGTKSKIRTQVQVSNSKNPNNRLIIQQSKHLNYIRAANILEILERSFRS